VAVELDAGKGYRIMVTSIYINPQTNSQWRETFNKLITVVLNYQTRNYVVIVAGDFNMQWETPKMQELAKILPWVARGESGHPRNGGNAREIDYVLSRRKIIKRSIPEYLKQVSDHHPIWCAIHGIHVSIKYRYTPSAAYTDRIIKKLIEKGYNDR
jgi:endonuclease/exonuclease/phosphatase family metal-dependent hydrolase